MKKKLVGAFVLFIAVVMSGVILQKINAQVDGEACQKEYDASRAKCIADNKTCNVACGENYDCKLACNLEANSCEEVAVDLQRKCFGVWPYDQSDAQGLPVVDIDTKQPNLTPIAPSSLPTPPQTTPSSQATPPPITTQKPPEQPDERSSEPAPQTIIEGANDIDSLFITLPGGFDPIFVTFLDRITENNPEIFLNEQPDEQQKMIDNFIKSGQSTTVVIGTIDGKPIEVDLRDVPLADTAKEPLEAVARQDIKSLFDIPFSLWFSEETLMRGAESLPAPGSAQEKYLLSEEYKQKGHFSVPFVSPIGLSFDEYHQKKGEALSAFESQFNSYVPMVETANGLSFSVILIGAEFVIPETTPKIVTWENVEFVTQPGGRQIGILNDTPFVLHPDSQVIIKDLNTLELSGGAVEIQRPDNPLEPSVTVETPLGSVKSDKTRFWVAYNPARGYTLVGVWEGAVSVTHAYTGETMKLEALENGMPNIALLLSPEFGKSKISAWSWTLLVMIAGGVGYFVYRKKDEIVKFFQKRPM